MWRAFIYDGSLFPHCDTCGDGLMEHDYPRASCERCRSRAAERGEAHQEPQREVLPVYTYEDGTNEASPWAELYIRDATSAAVCLSPGCLVFLATLVATLIPGLMSYRPRSAEGRIQHDPRRRMTRTRNGP